jgi:hypothetical protein
MSSTVLCPASTGGGEEDMPFAGEDMTKNT